MWYWKIQATPKSGWWHRIWECGWKPLGLSFCPLTTCLCVSKEVFGLLMVCKISADLVIGVFFFLFSFFYQMWAFVVCHQLASVFLLFVFELESLCVFKAGWPYYDCFCVHFVYTLFCLHLSLCPHHLQTGAELSYLKLIKLSGQFHQAQIIVCCKAQLLFLFLLTPIYFWFPLITMIWLQFLFTIVVVSFHLCSNRVCMMASVFLCTLHQLS